MNGAAIIIFNTNKPNHTKTALMSIDASQAYSGPGIVNGNEI